MERAQGLRPQNSARSSPQQRRKGPKELPGAGRAAGWSVCFVFCQTLFTVQCFLRTQRTQAARPQRAPPPNLQSLKRATCTNTTSLFYCLLSLRGEEAGADGGGGGGKQEW